MNQKFFLAAMSIRTHANKIGERVQSLSMLDPTGLVYQVDYWSGHFQQFRLSMNDHEIVYITNINEKI